MTEQHEAAGIHMDAEIHRRVFGEEITCDLGENCSEIPFYSTDIAAAMLVVEKINDLTDMTWNPFAEPGTEWAVRFSRAAYAPTLPLAICRAALFTVGESDG